MLTRVIVRTPESVIHQKKFITHIFISGGIDAGDRDTASIYSEDMFDLEILPVIHNDNK
jgi:hypothetical protein